MRFDECTHIYTQTLSSDALTDAITQTLTLTCTHTLHTTQNPSTAAHLSQTSRSLGCAPRAARTRTPARRCSRCRILTGSVSSVWLCVVLCVCACDIDTKLYFACNVHVACVVCVLVVCVCDTVRTLTWVSMRRTWRQGAAARRPCSTIRQRARSGGRRDSVVG